MTEYLVDTDVISAGAPSKKRALPALGSWMDRHSEHVFISAVTIAEIEYGIAKLRRTGVTHKAARLRDWLETLLHLYGTRVLPFDVAAARIAGAMTDRARASGHTPGFPDVAIAATAAARHLTILTGNVRHYEPLGVHTQNPFSELP
ncbi:MAG TPA: PIN domain-containing protein [Candidatus Baltobacteraceae bacterium]|nr:PIN domain-containing protein [Candidatus Baltobacteraceae bacterium]